MTILSLSLSASLSFAQVSDVDEDDFGFDIDDVNAAEDYEYFEQNFNPPSVAASGGNSTIDKDASLTEMFESKSPSTEESSKKSSTTWLDKIRSSGENDLMGETSKPAAVASTPSDTPKLTSLVEGSRNLLNGKRSNASVFDISGAMLRMTPAQVDEVLTRRGYRKINEKYEIPNFIKWRKEDECRAKGVIGYERLASCVIKVAKDENYQYLDSVSYAKYDSKENIAVRFTSNFTGNKAYKIQYSTAAAAVRGNSQKAIYMRNVKVYDFWKAISQKYGAPDNKEDVMWGLGGNKAFMQASTGRLLLEDPMLQELDYTRMSREDARFMNTGSYNF